jgi:hypothetical protein
MKLPLAFSLTVFSLGFACLQAQEPKVIETPAPGYDGSWPSDHGKEVLESLSGGLFRDVGGCLGGGQWLLELSWSDLPHPVGPGPLDAAGVTWSDSQGPHVILRRNRGRRAGPGALFLPTRCDGDVAALRKLLGQPRDKALKTAGVSKAWQRAMRVVSGVGEERHGVRVGLVSESAANHFTLLIWNVGEEVVGVQEPAQIQLGKFQLPIALLQSPAGVARKPARASVQIGPGAVFAQTVDLVALAKAPGHIGMAQFAKELRRGYPQFRVEASSIKRKGEQVLPRGSWIASPVRLEVGPGTGRLRPVGTKGK